MTTTACWNPNCDGDGWAVWTGASGEVHRQPCHACGKQLAPRRRVGEDDFTSTVDAAAAHAATRHRRLGSDLYD